MPSFELHRQQREPGAWREPLQRADVMARMRAAMSQQQWDHAAEIGEQWRRQGNDNNDWQIKLNLALSLSRTQRPTEQTLIALASEIWQSSKGHELAKLGLADLMLQMAHYEDCVSLLSTADLQKLGHQRQAKQLEAEALAKLGKFDQAIAVLESWTKAHHDWYWHMARAGIELERSAWPAAEAHYRQCLKDVPNNATVHHNLGLTLLSQSQWHEGWQEYEWRRSNPRRQTDGMPMQLPLLEQLKGQTINVIGEQGIGDQIMMMRYLPQLANHCKRVVVIVEPRLTGLFRANLPEHIHIEELKVAHDQHNDRDGTLIGTASLPLICGPETAADPTATAPITLQADHQLMRDWIEQLNPIAQGRPLIGLGWLGGSNSQQHRERGLGPQSIHKLTEDERYCWIDLQHLEPRWHHLRQRHTASCHQPMQNPGQDLAQTIALMATLDCVVTTRQTVAHLAGSLGMRGAVLIPQRQEWRYSQGDESWKWYPSLTCLNQSKRGEWTHELEQVKQIISAPQ